MTRARRSTAASHLLRHTGAAGHRFALAARIGAAWGAHDPRQPSWDCRSCSAPWPCITAQQRLYDVYRSRLIDLGVLLAILRDKAVVDLPDADPRQVGARFTGWYRRLLNPQANRRDANAEGDRHPVAPTAAAAHTAEAKEPSMTIDDRDPMPRRDDLSPWSNAEPSVAVRAAKFGDVPDAAGLLTRARLASGHQRLLGSGTATTSPTATEISDVLTSAMWLGHIDLAVADEQVIGVACWIHHPARTLINRGRRPSRVSPVSDLLGRLDLIDTVCHVPNSTGHHHLAYLGARPGYGSRAIADLLVHHRSVTEGRNRVPLVAEVHSTVERDWLLRRGFHYYGVSLGDAADPQSFVMARPGGPPIHIHQRPVVGPTPPDDAGGIESWTQM